MKYTTLLMDADDTVFDFPKCEYQALRSAMNGRGYPFDDEICSTFSRINAALWKKFEMNEITRAELRIRRFREMIGTCFSYIDDLQTVSRELADDYVRFLAQNAVYIKGAEEALEELVMHYDIYIITNGLKTVQRERLEISGLNRFVKKAYISDEMGVQKPDRKFFDMVLSDINEKDRTKVLVVGDSLTSDMQGGRNSGLDTCLYDPKGKVTMPHELCDYRITDLKELLSFE